MIRVAEEENREAVLEFVRCILILFRVTEQGEISGQFSIYSTLPTGDFVFDKAKQVIGDKIRFW